MSMGIFVVVGGSKGTGLGFVKRLVSDGKQVVVLSRTADELVGLEGLTRSLASKLAPAIRVNCIAPALTDTFFDTAVFLKR